MIKWFGFESGDKKPKLEFTDEDCKVLMEIYHAEISSNLNNRVVRNKSGLVTLDQITKDLEKILHGSGRTAIGLLAAELEIDRSFVEQICRKLYDNGTIYMNGTSIICEEEIKSLVSKLDQALVEGGGTTDRITFCRQNNIEFDALDHITAKLTGEQSASAFATFISRDSTRTRDEKLIIDELQKSTIPVKLSDLEAKKTISALQFEHLTQNKKGFERIEGRVAREMFIPAAYEKETFEKTRKILKEKGSISRSVLSQYDLTEDQFVLRLGFDVTPFGDMYFNKELLQSAVARYQKELNDQGYTVITYDLEEKKETTDKERLETLLDEEDPIVLEAKKLPFVATHVKQKLPNDVMYVNYKSYMIAFKSSLVNSDVIIRHFETIAEKTAEQLIEQQPSITKKDISKEFKSMSHEQGPTSISIMAFYEMVKYEKVKKALCHLVIRKLKEAYQKKFENVVNEFIESRDDKDTAKRIMYFNAVDSLEDYDKKLLEALMMEIRGKHEPKPQETGKILPFRTTWIDSIEKLQNKLEMADDIALILHLTTLITFDILLSKRLDRWILLKASGRYVPKILKFLRKIYPMEEDLSILNELRDGIREKIPNEDLKELGTKVKRYGLKMANENKNIMKMASDDRGF